MDLGSLTASLGVDTRGLNKAEKAVQSFGDSTQRTFSRVTKAAITFAAIWTSGKLVQGLLSLTHTASDLNETVSKSNTIFRDNAKEINDWAKNSATAFGLSRKAAIDNAATVGNMFDQLGAGTAIAAQTSKAMVELSADIASFHNVAGGAEQVLVAMMSAFRGEYDALQRYIPTITAATVQQQALVMTGKENEKQLTALEKAFAAQAIIVRDAGAAMGDFARTSDQLANQERILYANLEDIKAILGNELLPVVRDIVQRINAWTKVNKELIGIKVSEWANRAKNAFMGLKDAVGFMADAMNGLMRAWLVTKKAFLSTEELALKFKLWANEGEASEKKIRMELSATQQALADVTMAISVLDEEHQNQFLPTLTVTAERLNDVSKSLNGTRDASNNAGNGLEKLTKAQSATLSKWIDIRDSHILGTTDYEIKQLNRAFDEYKKVAKDKELVEQVRAAKTREILMKELTDKIEILKTETQGFHDAWLSIAEAQQQMDYDNTLEDMARSKVLIDELNEALKDQSSFFDSSIFGDDANQAVQNLAVSFEKLIDVYDEIGKKEDWLAEKRKEANEILDPDEQAKAFKKVKELETRYANEAIQSQLSGYRQLFSTTAQLFEENSQAYQAFALAEKAVMTAQILLTGVQAIVNAGASGDPYTAIARMAAMAVAVASVVSQVGVNIKGISGGGGGSSYSGGSYLTDQSDSWQTDSFADVYDMLEEYDAKQYGALLDIYYEIRALNKNITGLITGILKGVGSFDVEGFESVDGAAKTLWQDMTDLMFGWLPGFDSFIGQFLSGFITTFLGGIVDYIFGGGSHVNLLTIGMTQRGGSTLEELMGGGDVPLEWYAWLEEISKGGLFSSDSSRRWTEYYKMTDDFLEKLSGVFRGIVQSTVYIAEAFGFSSEQIKELLAMEIDLPGNLTDLEKMDDEELTKAFEKYFTKFADQLAESWFGDLIGQYQQIDEGMYEAAVRLVSEMVMVQEALMLTGNIVETSVEGWLELSQGLIAAADSVDALMESVELYFTEFFSEAEQFDYLVNSLKRSFDEIGIAMPATREEFKNLVSSLDLTTDEGRQLYVMLMDLAGATDQYYDVLEEANQTIIDAKRALTQTEDIGALSDIGARYGWNVGTESAAFEIIEAFLNATEETIRAYAKRMGVTTDQLVDDIMTLADIFGYLDDDVRNVTQSFSEMSDEIREILASLRESISGGGTNTAAQLMEQLLGFQSGVISGIASGDMQLSMENLLSMSQMLSQWYSQAVSEAEAAAREEEEAQKEALYAQRDALNEQLSVARAFASLVDRIDSVMESITYSALNVSLPTPKAITAQSQYDELYASAMSGNAEDAQAFVDFVQTYLQQQQEVYKSSETYQGIYAQVMAHLAEVQEFAETQNIEEDILAQLEAIEAAIEAVHVDADLTEINATFEAMAAWIEEMLAQLEETHFLLSINWENYEGTMAEAIENLMWFVQTYGWENAFTLQFISNMALWAAMDVERAIELIEYITANSGGWDSLATITFIAEIAGNLNNMTSAHAVLNYIAGATGWDSNATITFLANLNLNIFEDVNALANAAGWIANASGGWNTTATISFLKNVAANWEFEDINQILAAIGWVKQQAGSWTAQATISFIAALMNQSNIPIEHIDYWLRQMGIEDVDLRRTVTISLIYEMVQSGDLDLKQVADYVYNSAFSAWLMDAGASEAINILRQIEGIASMWDKYNTYDLGVAINAHGSNGYVDPNAWGDVWARHGQPKSWAEGGVVDSPTLGWIGEAGYPEAIIPMKDGTSIPVKWLNGGSTGSEGTANRPLNIVVQVGNEQFDAHITRVADNVRVKAERRPIGPRRI